MQAPQTSSAGRLFDVVASLVGLCQRASFEGQAALALESVADSPPIEEPRAYPHRIDASKGTLCIDGAPALGAILHDLRAGVAAPKIAARFHTTLPEVIRQVALGSGSPRSCSEAAASRTGACSRRHRRASRGAVSRTTGRSVHRVTTVDSRSGSLRHPLQRSRSVCLAVPGRICVVRGDGLLARSAHVDFGGARRDVSLAFVPEAQVGDFVIVHVGVALQRLDEPAALELLREIAALAGAGGGEEP